MLTAEIKINGKLIKHIYIVNETPTGMPDICKSPKDMLEESKVERPDQYRFEVYHVDDTQSSIQRGKTQHLRSKGALELIAKVIKHAARLAAK
jgi:hypothetical protein